MILNIHSHNKTPDRNKIIDISDIIAQNIDHRETIHNFIKSYPEQQLFSVGIHPWNTTEEVSETLFATITEIANKEQVVAIGETGIDLAKGGPAFRQMQLFKKFIELSEKLKKPLIIHNVKAHDIIIGLKKEYKPTQPWIIHGFRQKPQVAEMLLNAGCYLSLGLLHNEQTAISIPAERLFAETDDSDIEISETIHKISLERGEDITNQLLSNASTVLRHQQEE